MVDGRTDIEGKLWAEGLNRHKEVAAVKIKAPEKRLGKRGSYTTRRIGKAIRTLDGGFNQKGGGNGTPRERALRENGCKAKQGTSDNSLINGGRSQY